MKTASEISQEKQTQGDPHPLRVLRESHHLTLRDVEAQVGITNATLLAYERGAIPNVQNAMKLAAFYETTVEELFKYLKEKA